MRSGLPLEISENGKRGLSVGTIAGTGLILSGFEIWHTFQMQTLLGKVLEAILPLSVAITLIYASYWLSRSEFDGQSMLRITGWFIAGIAGMAVVAGWIVSHQFIRGVGFHHWHFMTAGSMTVGGAVGFLLGVYDGRSRRRRDRVIEERKKVEAEQEKLTLLNRILRHNILNSVNVIKGRAETHKDRSSADEHRDLDVVISRSNDIVDLIEKVHTFIERISTDGNTELKPVDLSSLLETEIEKARQSYPEAQISGDVPANTRVLADEMLAEVFENLLMNAVEHNDKDEPIVTVSLENREDATVVSVADNGPGIPDSQKEQIFAWNPEATSRPATGVGLSLVETLVTQYDGSIWIKDNEPEGSTFHVMLRDPHDQASAAEDPEGRNESATDAASNATGRVAAVFE